jgi:flagellar protein FliJ
MNPLDKLDKVAAKARADEARAARGLRVSRERHDAGNAQLDQLQRFKAEYESDLERIAATGMSPRQLEDYRRFLANLNVAIANQGGEVARAGAELENQREQMVRQRRRNDGLADYLARRRLEVTRADERRDQRTG